MEKKRIKYYDLMKGIAIFLVVMGHVLAMCIREVDRAFLFKFIGQVHMPIFFFISGYMTYKVAEHGGFALSKLGKRVKQLMIPFFVMSALWVWYFPHSQLESPLHDNLPDLYRAYWKDGYWFTLCLMELCLVYWPMSWLMSRLKSVWLQVLTVVATYAVLVMLSVLFADAEANLDLVGVGLLARFFPVFMMGVMAHRFKEGFNALWHTEGWLLASVIVFAVSFYAVVYPWDLPWLPEWTSFVTIPLMHASLMVLVLSMVEPWSNKEYAHEHKPSLLARYFNYLGNESLGIYLCHYFFLFPLGILREPVTAMGLANVPLIAISAVVASVVIAVTLLAMRVIKCSRILSLLMLGKTGK